MGHWIELNPEGAGPIPPGGPTPQEAARRDRRHPGNLRRQFAYPRRHRPFAAEGYLAVAPAIFEHVEPRFEVGYDADGERAAWRSPASRSRADAARCRRRDRGRQGRRQGRRSSAIASAARSLGRGGAPPGSRAPRSAITAARSSGEGPEAAGPDAAAFRREGPAYPDRGRQGSSPPPIRTSRSTSIRPITASTATIGRATTRRARRSPGRARWRSCASIWGETADCGGRSGGSGRGTRPGALRRACGRRLR